MKLAAYIIILFSFTRVSNVSSVDLIAEISLARLFVMTKNDESFHIWGFSLCPEPYYTEGNTKIQLILHIRVQS